MKIQLTAVFALVVSTATAAQNYPTGWPPCAAGKTINTKARCEEEVAARNGVVKFEYGDDEHGIYWIKGCAKQNGHSFLWNTHPTGYVGDLTDRGSPVCIGDGPRPLTAPPASRPLAAPPGWVDGRCPVSHPFAYNNGLFPGTWCCKTSANKGGSGDAVYSATRHTGEYIDRGFNTNCLRDDAVKCPTNPTKADGKPAIGDVGLSPCVDANHQGKTNPASRVHPFW